MPPASSRALDVAVAGGPARPGHKRTANTVATDGAALDREPCQQVADVGRREGERRLAVERRAKLAEIVLHVLAGARLPRPGRRCQEPLDQVTNAVRALCCRSSGVAGAGRVFPEGNPRGVALDCLEGAGIGQRRPRAEPQPASPSCAVAVLMDPRCLAAAGSQPEARHNFAPDEAVRIAGRGHGGADRGRCPGKHLGSMGSRHG